MVFNYLQCSCRDRKAGLCMSPLGWIRLLCYLPSCFDKTERQKQSDRRQKDLLALDSSCQLMSKVVMEGSQLSDWEY